MTLTSVLINGISLNQYSNEARNDIYGVLLQDYNLYPESVKNNITMGKDMLEQEVLAAIDEVELSDVIKDINQNISSEFSKDGLELSGGQKRRLDFARLIVHNQTVIVLDEPTSAMDVFAERNFYELVYRKLKENTMIFITHKLSPLPFIDRIIYM